MVFSLTRYAPCPLQLFTFNHFIYKRKYVPLDTKRDVDHKTVITLHKLMQKIIETNKLMKE